MFKPRVRLVCPGCNMELTCNARIFDATSASWVLTAKSFAHLKAADCVVPKAPVFLSMDSTDCEDAA